ncbi:ketopantoate reductase family protein [Parasporobacterium paucivorans]|uniref:2-dehydropantoate 2-reductase n=1 Tax=Parasporobacterium paucivorans DSM 15970 TaxID=1122934 RepID=A0A1M6JJF5_9FIRM|nr:2-dehydropantoate 2-reductase [Parasporobacterium paucivorans]SHJ46851.1 2-dehydropantoate 2-reductase [Parasporobacterium paucivorans DSM 15970]
MKIAVIGAGAMGCLYGTYLSAKNDVVLFDSYAPQVEAINRDGLTMLEDGKETTIRIRAELSGTDIGSADMVVVFVKSTQTYEAVKENQKLIDARTLVVTLQNGAGNDRDILQFARKENIVIGTSKHNSVGIGLGKFNHTASGITTIGTMDEDSTKDREVEKVLKDSRIDVEVSNDIQRIIWSKLFVNMSINTLTALLQTKIGYMTKNKYAWNFAKRVVYEGVDVAEADGTYFDRRETLEMVRKVCLEAEEGYSSMYQDRLHKRLTEIDRINGAVVEQAKSYGVATPYNSLIVDLIHAIEGTYDES